MDPYVAVSNDASTAVKSVIQMKKSFRRQMTCNEDLSKENQSLHETIRKLEKHNKELLALVSLFMQDSDLNDDNCNVLKQCPGSSKKNEDVIKSVDPSSECKDPRVCPTSPTYLNEQGNKRKITPQKPKAPRKSRRISTRK